MAICSTHIATHIFRLMDATYSRKCIKASDGYLFWFSYICYALLWITDTARVRFKRIQSRIGQSFKKWSSNNEQWRKERKNIGASYTVTKCFNWQTKKIMSHIDEFKNWRQKCDCFSLFGYIENFIKICVLLYWEVLKSGPISCVFFLMLLIKVCAYERDFYFS